MKKITSILKPYQIEHCKNIIDCLSKNSVCFDASDTGIGKTYCAIATAIILKKKIFLICPRSISSFWKTIANDVFNVKLLCISSYLLIINGKCIDDNDKSVICPYIKHNVETQLQYEWKLPKDTIIIFDEVHKCSNKGTHCSDVLVSLKNTYNENIKLLLLSATICESPLKFKLFGLLLNWYNSYYTVPHYLSPKYNPTHASELIVQNLTSQHLIAKVKISNILDFPKNTVSAEYFDIDKNISNKIDELYMQIHAKMNTIKIKKTNDIKNGLISSMRERQEIELLKVPIFIDLIEQYLDNNFSVIVFVNFIDTIKILAKELKTNCICYGEQQIKDREIIIKKFMEDKERVILFTIGTGGESISLNDINGKYRRVSLISPQWSSIKLIQACGRNSRINSKTPSLNVIVYANSPIEKRMCNKIKDKCSLYNKITDANLSHEDCIES